MDLKSLNHETNQFIRQSNLVNVFEAPTMCTALMPDTIVKRTKFKSSENWKIKEDGEVFKITDSIIIDGAHWIFFFMYFCYM